VELDVASRKALTGAPELRGYPAQFEVRKKANGVVELRGYASTFAQPYEMHDAFGAYSEVVRAGAFGQTLANGADVAYLANHGGLTMARTASGTLDLSEDSTGLETLARVNEKRGDVRDLVLAIEDGNVDQMSFGFRVVRQEWSPDYDERAMVELNLDRGDVSAVNYGANPATSVAAQRAFRSVRGSKIARLSGELRAGTQLATGEAELVSRILDALAEGEELRTLTEKLADGRAEPAVDAAARATDELERREAAAETLRLLAEHEAEQDARVA
jgi:HK97 family phage prohead protease